MQHCDSSTLDAPASHFTIADLHQLARLKGAQIFELAGRVVIVRGSFSRDFSATGDGLFRAAPIRSWLGL